MGDLYLSLDLRRLVYNRAQGRCEYCLFPELPGFFVHEIDHIISRKHGGPSISENLALCCSQCNKHKGSDIASIDVETGEIAPLFHPRRHRWSEHFKMNHTQIAPLTANGRVTVFLLQLNVPARIKEREPLIAGGLYQTLTALQ